MPLDPSIYGMIQQPKVATPFENTQQALTIKSLIDQDRMRPQMQQMAMQKAQGDINQQQASTNKTMAETHAQNIKISRDLLASAASEEDVNALREHVAKTYGPQAAAQIPNFSDPQFNSMRAQKIMDADNMLKRMFPELQSVDTGGAVQRVNPYTNEVKATMIKTPAPERQKTGKTALSATAQKELFEADDLINASNNAKALLAKALEYNNAAYSGPTAKSRMIGSRLVPDALMTKDASAGADAATELDNIMTGQALESLKAIFGGMPTEGERKILLDMQASLDKTPKQRKDIIDRAIQLADRRLQSNKNKAKALREGTFFTDQPDYPDATLPPVAEQPKSGNSGGIKFLGFE